MAMERLQVLEDPLCIRVKVPVIREIFRDLREGVNESVQEGFSPFAASAYVRTEKGLIRIAGARSNSRGDAPGRSRQIDHAEQRLIYALPPFDDTKPRRENYGDSENIRAAGICAINHPPCQTCAQGLFAAGFGTIICGPRQEPEVSLDPPFEEFVMFNRKRIRTLVIGIDGSIGAEQVNLGRAAVKAGPQSTEREIYDQNTARFLRKKRSIVADENLKIYTSNFALSMVYPNEDITEIGVYTSHYYNLDYNRALKRIAEITGRRDMTLERWIAQQKGRPDPGVDPLELEMIAEVLDGRYIDQSGVY